MTAKPKLTEIDVERLEIAAAQKKMQQRRKIELIAMASVCVIVPIALFWVLAGNELAYANGWRLPWWLKW